MEQVIVYRSVAEQRADEFFTSEAGALYIFGAVGFIIIFAIIAGLTDGTSISRKKFYVEGCIVVSLIAAYLITKFFCVV